MKPNDIRAIARQRNIATGRLSVAELIRTMQRQEGNNDCFATPAVGSCGQAQCLWRSNCLSATGSV